MPVSKFRTWKYADVVKAFATVIETTVGAAAFTENRLFCEKGDHWQDGNQWPTSGTLTAAMRTRVILAVFPQFRPVDAIGEVLDNVVAGLLDHEAAVTFTPVEAIPEENTEAAEAAEREADEMLDRLSRWWDRKRFWEHVEKATKRSRWSTRGALRFSFGRGAYAGEGDARGLRRDLPIDEALDAIEVVSPDPAAGMIYTDVATDERTALFLFQDGETKTAEIWFVEGDETFLLIVTEGGASKAPASIAIGKRLPMAQMEARLLIKDTVRRQQRTLNFMETVLVRVVDTAGFPERYTLNAKPQGIWMETAPTDGPGLEQETVEGKTWYLHPSPRTIGPAITTDLRGVTTKDLSTGAETVASPGVVKFDPTDPDYLIRASNHGRITILRECKQGHLANESTTQLSGIAYVQARAVHEKDLKRTKPALEGMIRDAMETLIGLVEFLSPERVSPGVPFLSRYRVVVNVHVDAGPRSPEEISQDSALNKAGLLSDETVMARSGVEDAAAEQALIAQSPRAIAELRTAQGNALASLINGGCSFLGACKFLGIDETTAKELQATDETRTDPALAK